MFEPSFLFGQFVGGLSIAMFLFLIASGLSLIFGVLRILNFAHGSFYMVGAYLAWQPQSRTLDALGGYGLVESHVRLGGEHVKMLGARISPAVLSTLGVAPQIGRLFTEDDDRSGAAPAVILSDALARERPGSPAGAVGAALVLDGLAHTIVGVMPPASAFPEPGVRFWIPYAIPGSPARRRDRSSSRRLPG